MTSGDLSTGNERLFLTGVAMAGVLGLYSGVEVLLLGRTGLPPKGAFPVFRRASKSALDGAVSCTSMVRE